MSQLVVAPILVAFLTAVVALLTRPWPRLQRLGSVLGGAGYLLAVAALLRAVQLRGPLVYQVSGWPAPFGISLVADALATLVLALGAVVSLPAILSVLPAVDERGQRLSFHALYHLMIVGVTGSVLTGDLFNLFVWFEVMLMASYVLVAFYGGALQTRAALQYLVLNLVGGAVMLLAVGGIYATTGTLNMADLARRLADPGAYGIDPAPVLGLSALLFAVFALKAGIVPFHFWVPPTYRAAPAPVTAVLAGVVKKVGIYAIIRLYFTVFAAATIPLSFPGLAGDSVLAFYGPVLFVIATASILLGGIGAIARDDLDGVLAYSSISQVGFIVLPLAVAATVPALRTLGIAAALVYAVNHGLAKGALFLVSGALRARTGTVQLPELGGIADRDPVLAGAFGIGALALVGIPPLTGFFGKFLIFDVGARARAPAVLAVALAGAILTILYVSRAWNRGFWGEPTAVVVGGSRRPVLVAMATVLALSVVVLGVGVEPLAGAATAGAEAAIDRQGYVDAVLGVGA